MKRWLLTIMIMIMAGFTGCSQGKNVEYANKDEEAKVDRIKITVAFWNAETALAGDDVLDAIEEQFGVELEPLDMTWNDYYQKVERWAATDSLPDIFIGDFRNSVLYPQWIQNGLLCAIPDDLSAYPNLAEYIDGLEETQIVPVNGKLYCIPRLTYPSQEWTSIDRVVAYRWDLAQDAGITKEPENWDEFQEMILAIIREDPERTGIQGMTVGNSGLLTGLLLPYASPIAACTGNDFYWKKDIDSIYKPVYFVDDMICAFQLGRDMYMSGVIEKDVIQQTASSARDKFLRGENAAILYSGGAGGVYENMGKYWEQFHNNNLAESVKLLHLMPDVNGTITYPVWGYAWCESYISAKADAEKLDKILQIYDYLLSDEGAFFAAYGPEGALYELVDGRAELYDMDVDVIGRYPSCEVLSILVHWDSSLYDERFPSTVPVDCLEMNYELLQEAKSVQIPEYEPECRRIMKEEQIDFSLDLNRDFLRIMTGTDPVEEMWEEIKGEYEEKGLQDMIDIINDKMQTQFK